MNPSRSILKPHSANRFEATVHWVLVCLLLVFFNALGLGTDPGTWRIAASWTNAQSRLPGLPPLAVVEGRDDSGETWQVSGSISGSPAVAAVTFETCFMRQGWQLDKVIPTGRKGHVNNLYLWRKGRHDILLMLWESGVAKTGFAFGLSSNQQEKKLKK